MSSKTAEMNSVISNLRACLISSQDGIRMESLNRDYMQIIGENIPFKRFGHNQLEEFLKSIPEINVKRKGGDVFIEAKESQASSHVTKLVAKQKKSGKKRPRINRYNSKYSRPVGPQFRPGLPYFRKRVYKLPLIPAPIFNHQKQCFLPLQINVPLQNFNNHSRQVSDLNNKSTKSNNFSSYHTNNGEKMDNVNRTPQVNKNKSNYQSAKFNESKTQNMISEAVCKTSLIPPLLPTKNVGVMKANHSEQIVQECSKKVKQSAQNRLNQIRNKNKSLVTVQMQQGESTSLYQKQLTSYVQTKGWEEPAYKVLTENSGKRAPESVDCGTFPNGFFNVDEAKECVAKKALDNLKKREVYNTYSIIQDPDLIIQRVERMVKEKDTGIWASKIEDEHRNLFKEILPTHWLDVVLTSDYFIVEELANSSLLIKAKEHEVSVSYQSNSGVPQLIFPEGGTWDVYVTKATSVNNVSLRFIGDDYSGMLDSLTSDMEIWYQQKEHLVNPFLVVGEHYASYCNESWARVVVLKINIDDIYVRFIDHGDEDVLPRSVIYRLEPKFMSILPAQAITVSLKNLEANINSKEAPDYLISTIVGKCLIAVVEQRSPKVSVTLYDTSQEEAVNLNEKLKCMFNLDYRRPLQILEGSVHQAFIGCIDESGNVFCQFSSETFDLFLQLMDIIDEGTYENHRMKNYYDLKQDQIYILDSNSMKYRVKVVDSAGLNGQIIVNFIDSGGEESVFIEDLYNLERMSYTLTQIPPQAVPTRLYEVTSSSFSSESIARLEEMINCEQVVVKIRKIVNDVPIVELFKRTVPENLMASINQTLILDSSFKQCINRLDHLNIKLPSKVEISGIKSLMSKIISNFPIGSIEKLISENRPVLPDIGEEFQILVQQTANPSLILIQPLEYVRTIQILEKDMCEYYNNLNLVSDLKINEGNLCAVRNKNYWYRAYIDKVIGSDSVSVKLLDYGSISLVLNTDLRKLSDRFTKVPFVGFCCKIHGILPKHGDWSVEDCLKTRQLIDHKKLLAQVKGVALNKPSIGGISLELQLFEVNAMTGHKFNIGDALIQKGCAKYEV